MFYLIEVPRKFSLCVGVLGKFHSPSDRLNREWGTVRGPARLHVCPQSGRVPAAEGPELLTNMGFELTPFTTGGVSGYTLHRAGCAPFIHNPEAANLPHVDTVRNTLRSTSKVLA